MQLRDISVTELTFKICWALLPLELEEVPLEPDGLVLSLVFELEERETVPVMATVCAIEFLSFEVSPVK
jgi:hypothetical protein